VRLRCPNPDCACLLRVEERLFGRKVCCPKCKTPFIVPNRPTVAGRSSSRSGLPTEDVARSGRTSDGSSSSQKQKAEITVGLDFGTDTVKCIIHARVGVKNRPRRRVVRIDGETLFPSVVWVSQGRLSVGQYPSPDAIPYRSVKVCLRCSVLENEPCRRCFEGTDLTAELASWAILSHCVQRIRGQIELLYPERQFDRDIEWNMGAPLDGLDQIPLRCLFGDLLWKAVHHPFSIGEGVDLRELSAAYAGLESVHCPPQSQDGANCFIVSEADAAVNGFLNSGLNIERGHYYICDIGAGTIDIAFFWYNPREAPPISFYGTSCTRIGGDDFAWIVARDLQEKHHGLNPKQALMEANRLLSTGSLPTMDARDGFEALYEGLHKAVSRTFGKSYAKEKRIDHWSDLRLIAIGGAVGITGVADSCCQPICFGGPYQTIEARRASMDLATLPDATPLHGIAYGLSTPIHEMHESHTPEEVEEAFTNWVPHFRDKPDFYE